MHDFARQLFLRWDMAIAQHPKTSTWIRQGIFDDLKSFEEFEARVNRIPEEKDRGDAFEIFTEAFLATQPIAQCVKHWVVGNIPLPLRERYRLPPDTTGIDGIYEAHDGSHVAYQVKYRQRPQLTYAEVAPFLGITERFTDRVIFTNAATLSDKAIQRTRWFSREAFLALSAEALAKIEAWLKQKPISVLRAQPDPRYQTQALADIKSTLAVHDRGNVVMACGSGKTLVSLWAAEQAEPKTVLVLVPSLTLLQQTLQEWSEQTSWGSRFSYICVCSDKTVGLKDDALNTDKSEVGFRVDTDPETVRRFLTRETNDVKIVFSTYQSAPVVSEGARGLPPFDLAIFDEAHKTTGREGGLFSFGLFNANIPIRKRLFLTATPRHIDIRHRDKEGEFKVQSMDDETVYGPRSHTLSFAAAVKKGIICPYKVIISLIDKQMVSDFARRHGITIVKRDEISARWVANLIALQQAVEKVGADNIITFHSRVKTAQEFAASEPRGIGFHLPGHEVRHVNGAQRSSERGEIIRAFAAKSKAILTNARCLTEGVNIPAVDMVAFIDPRQSRVDIAQAVGRAMRKPRGETTKQCGYVLVPLFAGMGDKDSIEEAIRSEKCGVMADVLNALQEHDEELVDIIREIRERKGRGEMFNPRRLNEKLTVVGPMVRLEDLSMGIGVAVADRIGSSWDEFYGSLQRYKEREGNCLVPRLWLEGKLSLGKWVSYLRPEKDRISEVRRQRLDTLGFEWDPFAARWEEGFAALKQFHAREGHCHAPTKYIANDFKLGNWASHQRELSDRISAERRQRMSALGFVWDRPAAAWEKGFSVLKQFYGREQHCCVPIRHIEAGYRLGGWVNVQRRQKDSMSADRRQRLEALGFVWDPFSVQWEEGFALLRQFRNREHHCRVPGRHIENGFKLGTWAGVQRKAKNSISEVRRKQLAALGFVWDPFSSAWEEGFAALKQFSKREGHCQVPKRHTEDGFILGQWIASQRSRRGKLSPDRRERLDAIGFVWDSLSAQWEEGFVSLQKYYKREGNCLVPAKHIEREYKLGRWVSYQRKAKDSMSAERRQRLAALGFVWDPLVMQWEEGFAVLKRFHQREHHCRVPNSYVEKSFKLGNWVGIQRRVAGTMPAERKQRLDALGFVWRMR